MDIGIHHIVDLTLFVFGLSRGYKPRIVVTGGRVERGRKQFGSLGLKHKSIICCGTATKETIKKSEHKELPNLKADLVRKSFSSFLL